MTRGVRRSGRQRENGRDKDPHSVAGDQTGNQRGDDPDNRTDQDARPLVAPHTSPEADTNTDRKPAAHSHPYILVGPGDRVTERQDDDRDRGRDPDRQPNGGPHGQAPAISPSEATPVVLRTWRRVRFGILTTLSVR